MALKKFTRQPALTLGQYVIARMAAQAAERIFAGEKLTEDETRWARVCLNCVLRWAEPSEQVNGRIVFAANVLEDAELGKEIRR